MSEQKINPQQVTKPIQLLAAWLVGLILINGSFLSAANIITNPGWAAGLLVIAAVLNVPIFLTLIFFLQTKFRPELQEDTYYSKHLEKITGNPSSQNKSTERELFLSRLKSLESKNDDRLEKISESIDSILETLGSEKDSQIDINALFEQINQTKETLNFAEIEKIKSSTKIALNLNIPNYKKVATELVKSGFSISDTFGEDHSRPDQLTITYTPETPKTALAEIYKITKPYGFKRIDFDDETFPFNEVQKVYIGSYIDEFDGSRSVAISDDVESAILDENVSLEQLSNIIVTLRKR